MAKICSSSFSRILNFEFRRKINFNFYHEIRERDSSKHWLYIPWKLKSRQQTVHLNSHKSDVKFIYSKKRSICIAIYEIMHAIRIEMRKTTICEMKVGRDWNAGTVTCWMFVDQFQSCKHHTSSNQFYCHWNSSKPLNFSLNWFKIYYSIS